MIAFVNSPHLTAESNSRDMWPALHRVAHRADLRCVWLICGLLFVGSLMADDEAATSPELPAAQITVGEAVISDGVTSKPRWELGLGGGYFAGFDYPASRDTNERALVVPFFVYRSPILRLGDGGVRAVAIERPRLKLDLSIGGSLNASSEDSSVREGMEDLDFLFELGPQLELRLFDRRMPSGARLRGRFTSELRAVFSTDFKSVDAQGFVADVGLGVNVANVAGSSVSFLTGFDVSFATEQLHDYFYQVDPEFVTASRPAFDAKGGYLESTLVIGFAFRPLPDVRVFTGIIQGFYSGARNQDSPLFEVSEQTRFALGVVWTAFRSKTLVEVVDLGSSN